MSREWTLAELRQAVRETEALMHYADGMAERAALGQVQEWAEWADELEAELAMLTRRLARAEAANHAAGVALGLV